ncbi:Uncharacterised protein [Mycobacteroides abscessus subsp. abscessus]|nr:Uncharacterised protein [Mycobacteroides abscessus subsp. abscessus]SKU40240.1 Uncharacterised protein [Mycobacteroides abscessus subsp. abscessus]
MATPARPRSDNAWPLPISSRRLSISVSTRETKNEATEWILDKSRPASLAASRPLR